MSKKIEPLEIEDSSREGDAKKSGLFLSYKKISLILILFSAILVACILATYFGKPDSDKEEMTTLDDEKRCKDFYCKNLQLLECKKTNNLKILSS